MHLKFFWTLFKNMHCQGPCSLRPCISRPYCNAPVECLNCFYIYTVGNNFWDKFQNNFGDNLETISETSIGTISETILGEKSSDLMRLLNISILFLYLDNLGHNFWDKFGVNFGNSFGDNFEDKFGDNFGDIFGWEIFQIRHWYVCLSNVSIFFLSSLGGESRGIPPSGTNAFTIPRQLWYYCGV